MIGKWWLQDRARLEAIVRRDLAQHLDLLDRPIKGALFERHVAEVVAGIGAGRIHFDGVKLMAASIRSFRDGSEEELT